MKSHLASAVLISAAFLLVVALLSGCQALVDRPTYSLVDESDPGFKAPLHRLPQSKRCQCGG